MSSRSDKMDKIWANRVQKEVENLKVKPPKDVELDSRTVLDESAGRCIVYCRCNVIDHGDPDPAAAEENNNKSSFFVLELDLSVDKRYPFEVPIVRVVEGIELFPEGAIQKGTNILNSPADSDIWTPSHSIETLTNTILAFLKSGMAWPIPRVPTVTASTDDDQSLTKVTFQVGQVVQMAYLREMFGESMFPCRPVATSMMEEMRFKLYPARHLVVTPAQLVMLEESRLRPSNTTILAARLLQDLSKLHFKRGGSKLSFVFKEIDSSPTVTVSVELENAEEASDCVKDIKTRLEEKGVSGTRTSVSKTRALQRAEKLLEVAKLKAQEQPKSLEDVTKTMDLFRQSAEQFAAMTDNRHSEVLGQLHEYLQSEVVQQVLNTPPEPVPETQLESNVTATPASEFNFLPSNQDIATSEVSSKETTTLKDEKEAAQLKAEQEVAEAAQLKAEQEAAEAAQLKAEQEAAEAAQLKAEQEAAEAQLKAEQETAEAVRAKAEEEAARLEIEEVAAQLDAEEKAAESSVDVVADEEEEEAEERPSEVEPEDSSNQKSNKKKKKKKKK